MIVSLEINGVDGNFTLLIFGFPGAKAFRADGFNPEVGAWAMARLSELILTS